MTARLAVVRVRQGRIVYRDPDAPWTVEIRGLDADGRQQPDALALSAGAESLRFESPALHEHVDGHQQAFTAHEAAQGRVLLVDSEADLHTAIDRALADPSYLRLPQGATEVGPAVERVASMIDDLVARRRPAARSFQELSS